MCTYVYKGSYNDTLKRMELTCPCPEIYRNSQPPDGSSSVPALPMDEHGCCIFHSKEIAWKRQQNFTDHLRMLIRFIEVDQKRKFYDFCEFVFVGDEIPNKPGSHEIQIEGMLFSQEANFTAASFLDSLAIETTNFKRGANFRQSIFYDKVNIKNSSFNGIDFRESEFRKILNIVQLKVISYCFFSQSRFIADVIGHAVKFEDVCFDAMTDFSNSQFDVGEQSTVEFRRTEFKDTVDFNGARFAGQAIFNSVSFAGYAEFIDTAFSTVTSTARYRGCAVEFNDLVIKSGAVLRFESTNAQQKLFNSDVQYSFARTPEGQISFQNVNFHNILAESRKILMNYARQGRVDIGSGCIKYRFQTPVRKISVDSGNTALIMEISQTFSHYFTEMNGINLGVEIVERTETEIHLFYFTDENISEELFYERLAVTEQQLWKLLSIRSYDQLPAPARAASSREPANKQSAVINAVDGLTAMFSIFFRAGIRIALKKWSEDDTRALLSAIRFNDDDLVSRTQGLHHVLVDQYTGNVLFGINTKQNAGLPPMVLEYNKKTDNEAIDVAILTAIEVERKAACQVFGISDANRVKKGGRWYWKGKLSLGDGSVLRMVVAQPADMGQVEATALTKDVLHEWKPRMALLVGIAASTDPKKVRLGDIVVGKSVWYYEAGKVTSSGTLPQPEMMPADSGLLHHFTGISVWSEDVNAERPDGSEGRPVVHQGVIASGEKVIADAIARDKIASGHRKIIAIAMEDYGFSRAIWQNAERVQHLVIRGICDDGSVAKDDKWHKYAAASACAFAKHLLLDGALVPR